jgi:hypothetical protein
MAPPRWVKAIRGPPREWRARTRPHLTDDADARLGKADGSTSSISSPAGRAAGQARRRRRAVPIGRPNPMPAGGVVKVGFERQDQQVTLTFDWAAPAGAAVFRRGEAVWIVFDTPARLDISKLPAVQRPLFEDPGFKGADYSACASSPRPAQPYVAEGQGGRGRSAWAGLAGHAGRHQGGARRERASRHPVGHRLGRDQIGLGR